MADIDPRVWPSVTIGDKQYQIKITWGTILRAKAAGIDIANPVPPGADQTEQIVAMAKLFAAVLGTKKNPIDWEELAEEIDVDKQAEILAAIEQARTKALGGVSQGEAPAPEPQT